MPKRYVAIRNQLIEEGMPEKDAKSAAAAMYNDTRKVGEPALTDDYDSKHPYKAPAKKKMKKKMKGKMMKGTMHGDTNHKMY